MHNQKITVYLEGNYKELDYDFFINSFVKNYFFLYSQKIIEKLLFIPLKIKEEDKERIIYSFTQEKLDLQNYIQNNHSSDNYKDVLYTVLLKIDFHLLKLNEKIIIIKELKVPQYLHQTVLADFNNKSSK